MSLNIFTLSKIFFFIGFFLDEYFLDTLKLYYKQAKFINNQIKIKTKQIKVQNLQISIQ